MRVLIGVCAISVVIPCASLSAQRSAQPGDRVRVTAPALHANGLVGTCVAVRGDALELIARDSLMAIPLAQVMQLEVSQGRKPSGLGGVIGFLGGAVVGTVFGWFAYQDDYGAPTCDDYTSCPVIVGTLVVGGTIVGALMGATERWEEVPHDPIRMSVLRQWDGGVAIGLSLAF